MSRMADWAVMLSPVAAVLAMVIDVILRSRIYEASGDAGRASAIVVGLNVAVLVVCILASAAYGKLTTLRKVL